MKIYPIFIPHRGCPFNCIFCNQFKITKSGDLQSAPESDLKKFILYNRGKTRGVAFYGGTFTALPEEEQDYWLEFIRKFRKDLDDIRVSTRPDFIDCRILDKLKEFGVTTIETGIQSLHSGVLKKSKRGYSGEKAAESCHLIKRKGFRLGMQFLPGLPGFSQETWNFTVDKTLEIKPDFVRIYPLLILKDTELEKLYVKGEYKPLDLTRAIELSADAVLRFRKAGIRIAKVGLHSDINKEDIVSGPFHPAFGELIRAELLKRMLVDLDIFKLKYVFFSSKDESVVRGHGKIILKDFLDAATERKIEINFDPEITKGSVNGLY
ncbi:MAG: radical SAM protein [Candidatus Cloacimonadota bacterium]|nr:MAG: radical SAM protein [Candidatus Cloacimonadota bacterium]